MKPYTKNQIHQIIYNCCKEINYEPKHSKVEINALLGMNNIVAKVDGHKAEIYLSSLLANEKPEAFKKYVKNRIMEAAEEAKREQLILELAGVEQ